MENLKLAPLILFLVLFSAGCTADSNKSSEPKSPDLFTPHSVITDAYSACYTDLI